MLHLKLSERSSASNLGDSYTVSWGFASQLEEPYPWLALSIAEVAGGASRPNTIPCKTLDTSFGWLTLDSAVATFRLAQVCLLELLGISAPTWA